MMSFHIGFHKKMEDFDAEFNAAYWEFPGGPQMKKLKQMDK